MTKKKSTRTKVHVHTYTKSDRRFFAVPGRVYSTRKTTSVWHVYCTCSTLSARIVLLYSPVFDDIGGLLQAKLALGSSRAHARTKSFKTAVVAGPTIEYLFDEIHVIGALVGHILVINIYYS